MSKVYRVGALGFAHQHINDLLPRFGCLPNVQWVACADNQPMVVSKTMKQDGRLWNLKHAHEVIGIPKVYDDYREMLAKEKFDVIVSCPENAACGEVAEAITAAGAYMVTEKPMSASLADALRMARAAKKNGVEVIVNWPVTWSPNVRKMKEIIDSGLIGEVWEVKWRNGASLGPLSYSTGDQAWTDEEKGGEWWHNAAAGGGALLDYCCYGACLSRWYIGQPAVAATAMRANFRSHYGDADDNAIITVRFPEAFGLLEATWSTWNVGVPTGPIVYGTKGTLVSKNRMVGGRRSGVVEVYTSRSHGATEPDEVIEGDPLPEGRATLGEEVIHHLETGEPLHETLQMERNLEVMAILDAGIRSAASGKVELVNDATWCIS